MKIKNLKQGFTLIELMIVITVIAILAGIVLFGLGAAQKNARDVQRTQIMKAAQVALQSFASDNNGSYPSAANWAGLNAAPTVGLTGYFPTGGLIDPGCGTGSGGNVVGAATPPTNCSSANPMPTYYYFVGAQPSGIPGYTGTCPGGTPKYSLVLAKESGGYALFCAPQ